MKPSLLLCPPPRSRISNNEQRGQWVRSFGVLALLLVADLGLGRGRSSRLGGTKMMVQGFVVPPSSFQQQSFRQRQRQQSSLSLSTSFLFRQSQQQPHPNRNKISFLVVSKMNANSEENDSGETSTTTTTTTTTTTATATQPKTTNDDDNTTNGSDSLIDTLSQQLQESKQDFDAQLSQAATLADAETIRRYFLSKKGVVNQVMGQMKHLSAHDKPKLGSIVNEYKAQMEHQMTVKVEELQTVQLQQQIELDRHFDVTRPGLRRNPHIGRRHPLSMTMEKAVDIFVQLGYDTVTDVKDSPEIETDYYCFEALNCPKDHPARDMQDTFYLTSDREQLLRTHTSAVQIRQLEQRKNQLPLRIVAPGRVFRKDDIDATHSLCFHQVEILALEPAGELTLGHLKGTVEYFLQQMFGPKIPVRFRGSYFPFTEPSMEVDVFFKHKWLEVLGCGMVDPAVLIKAGIDPNEYSGFAAGFGIERFAMVMHEINDLREFYKNDYRFLQQFPHFCNDGMMSFLSGGTKETEPKPKETIHTFPTSEEMDIRGEQVPEPFVDSFQQLGEQQQKQQNEQATTATTEKTESSQSKSSKTSSSSPSPQPSASSNNNNNNEEIDISKLDIRVGVIRKIWPHPTADKLYCEEIDLGLEEYGDGDGDDDGDSSTSSIRQIASGLRPYYPNGETELVGQRVLVLTNLKTRKLMGFPSHGMVLCATSDDGTDVQIVEPPAEAALGERVIVPGYGTKDSPPATENQVLKKKLLEQIFPDLATNDEGIACYKGIPFQAADSELPCRPVSLRNAPVS